MRKKVVLFGEYLLRLMPPLPQKLVQADTLEMHWAGSEANVGVSLSVLGDEAVFVTCMPQNELARAGLAQLHKYGLVTKIHWKEGRAGLYFYEAGQGVRPGRVLYDRNYSAFSLLKKGDMVWNEIFTGADWFHWSGITPALNKDLAEVCFEALQMARQNGLTISADFNYRSTLWQYGRHCREVMPPLLSHCDVVLADVNAAKLYFDITPEEKDVVASTCSLLTQKLPVVKSIALTMRQQTKAGENQYTGYLWSEDRLFTSRAYNIDQMAERIGAGDAFMAGLIFALRQKKPPQEVIEWATACGVIKHSFTGDFNVATREEIEMIMQQSGSGKIIR